MGVFDGYLLCSDCDWTLTDSNRKISRENSEAIRYFQKNGGLFTVATGRPPHYIQEFREMVEPNTYVVACNGTVLYDLAEDRPVCTISIEQDVEPLLEFIYRELPGIVEVCATGETEELFRYTTVPGEEALLYGGSGGKYVKSFEEIRKIVSSHRGEKICRLILVQDASLARQHLAKLIECFGEEYKFTQSWAEGLEAQNLKSGKGEMILRLKSLLPAVHTAVGVGDNDNDLSMLDLTDISFAVANAPDFVKAHADRLTVSCDESAVADVIACLGEINKTVDR